jgi:hypothetical protein
MSMTVGDLLDELVKWCQTGGVDDPVFVESHGMSSPLLYTEPTDGLENLVLIGAELEIPATPRIFRRRARARHLLYADPRRKDPSR